MISSAIVSAIPPAVEQAHPWLISGSQPVNQLVFSVLKALSEDYRAENIQLLLACLSAQMSEARLIRERTVIHYVWTEYHSNMLQ